MGRTIACKLGAADAALEEWLDEQQESPSSLIRRALILLMNSGEPPPSLQMVATAPATIDTKQLADAITDAFKKAGIGADITNAIKEGLKGLSLPISINGNGYHDEPEPAAAQDDGMLDDILAGLDDWSNQ